MEQKKPQTPQTPEEQIPKEPKSAEPNESTTPNNSDGDYGTNKPPGNDYGW